MKMRSTTKRALGVAVLAAMLAACDGSTHASQIDFFRVGPGPNQVTVLVGVDKPAPSVEASVIEESDTLVRIHVEVGNKTDGLDKDHPVVGVGETVARTVTLHSPLGDRTVVNDDGSPVLPEPRTTS